MAKRVCNIRYVTESGAQSETQFDTADENEALRLFEQFKKENADLAYAVVVGIEIRDAYEGE